MAQTLGSQVRPELDWRQTVQVTRKVAFAGVSWLDNFIYKYQLISLQGPQETSLLPWQVEHHLDTPRLWVRDLQEATNECINK